MENREDILKELREIAPTLSSLEKVNLYQVPENYFLSFQEQMLGEIKLSETQQELSALAPELSKLGKPVLNEIPVNYFGAFSGTVLNKIRQNELEELAPTLSRLEKANRLQVPADYFNSFPQQMLERVSKTEPLNTLASSWMSSLNSLFEELANIFFKPKYAYAFTGTVSIVIIGVMMLIKVDQCNDLDCRMASLTDAEINAYLDSNIGGYSEEIFETVSDEKISSDELYKSAFKGISDEELDDALLL